MIDPNGHVTSLLIFWGAVEGGVDESLLSSPFRFFFRSEILLWGPPSSSSSIFQSHSSFIFCPKGTATTSLQTGFFFFFYLYTYPPPSFQIMVVIRSGLSLYFIFFTTQRAGCVSWLPRRPLMSVVHCNLDSRRRKQKNGACVMSVDLL